MLLNAHLIHFKNEVENVVYCPEIHVFNLVGSGELIKDAKCSFYHHYPTHLEEMRLDETEMGDGFKNTLERHLVMSANWQLENGILVPPIYSEEAAVNRLVDFYADLPEFDPLIVNYWKEKILIPIYEPVNENKARGVSN